MCKLVGLSRQGYYRSKKQLTKKQDIAKQVVRMAQSIRNSQPMLGGKKLYHKLYKQLKELKVGRDKFFDILRANNMLIKAKKSYHVTTDSHHRFKKHKNRLIELEIDHPEQVWVADITYIGNRSNPLYLALITDAYSKKIMGYDVSDSLDHEGSLRALKQAIKARSYVDQKLIHHSDRGVQYCCNAYQELLAKANITCSMTETYDPYANAIAERVNGILKQEFIPDGKNINLVDMQKIIKQSVDIYNHERPHWSCHLLTPQQMHEQQELTRKTYRNKKTE